jgi:hypothetical protein
MPCCGPSLLDRDAARPRRLSDRVGCSLLHYTSPVMAHLGSDGRSFGSPLTRAKRTQRGRSRAAAFDRRPRPKAEVAVNRLPDRFTKLYQIEVLPSWQQSRGVAAESSDYSTVQHYTPERISYWLCSPTALEFRGSQDGQNAVRLRRAER